VWLVPRSETRARFKGDTLRSTRIPLPRSGFVQSGLLPAGNRIDTTALYTRVATNTIREVVSPLDRLTPLMPKKNEPKDGPPA
jgi:hypothetical protein